MKESITIGSLGCGGVIVLGFIIILALLLGIAVWTGIVAVGWHLASVAFGVAGPTFGTCVAGGVFCLAISAMLRGVFSK